MQESLARSRYMWKTLAGLVVLLDSCFRRKDGAVQERRMLVFCTVSQAGTTDIGLFAVSKLLTVHWQLSITR